MCAHDSGRERGVEIQMTMRQSVRGGSHGGMNRGEHESMHASSCTVVAPSRCRLWPGAPERGLRAWASGASDCLLPWIQLSSRGRKISLPVEIFILPALGFSIMGFWLTIALVSSHIITQTSPVVRFLSQILLCGFVKLTHGFRT
jgi:hypothetical protein